MQSNLGVDAAVQGASCPGLHQSHDASSSSSPPSCPTSAFDDFVTTLCCFLAANNLVLARGCTMDIETRDTMNATVKISVAAAPELPTMIMDEAAAIQLSTTSHEVPSSTTSPDPAVESVSSASGGAPNLEKRRHSPKRPRLNRDCTPTDSGGGDGSGSGSSGQWWDCSAAADNAWTTKSMSLPRLATTMTTAAPSTHHISDLKDTSFTYMPITPQVMSAGAASSSCFSDAVEYLPCTSAVDESGGGDGGAFGLNLASGDSSSSISPSWIMSDGFLMEEQLQSRLGNNTCVFSSAAAAAYHHANSTVFHDNSVHNDSSITNTNNITNSINSTGPVVLTDSLLPQSRSHRFVMEAAQFVLRSDYLQYLAAEIPRWVRWGLWEQQSPHLAAPQLSSSSSSSSPVDTAPVAGGDYPSLQAAYAAVCQLQTRMGDDSIRSRIALIELHKEYLLACDRGPERNGDYSQSSHHQHKEKHSVGRGELTSIIDHIMEGTYADWATLDAAQQKKRRAQFHDRKRYGRRWAILTSGLGEGIVFLASSKLTQIVRNTTVTYDALNLLVDQVLANPHLGWFLHQIAPLARQLYQGAPCSTHLAAALLDKIGALEQQGLECVLMPDHQPWVYRIDQP